MKDAGAAVAALKPWVIMGATPIVYGTTLVDTEDYVFQYFPGWNDAVNLGHTRADDLLALKIEANCEEALQFVPEPEHRAVCEVAGQA